MNGYRRIFAAIAFTLAFNVSLHGIAHAQADAALSQVDATLFAEANTVQDLVLMGQSPGFGTLSAAAVAPCFLNCTLTSLGNVQLTINGGANSYLSNASAAVAGIGNATTSGDVSQNSTTVPNGFALTNLSATAIQDGTTGSAAAAGSIGWDYLTFSGAAPGQMGTVSLTLTLTQPSGTFGLGAAGGCLSVNSICSPGGLLGLSNAGDHVTIVQQVPLNAPALVFDGLYAVADNSFNITGATIDPNLVLSLPAGVSFTAVSGDSGVSAVPEPSTVFAFGFGLAVVAISSVRRYRWSPRRGACAPRLAAASLVN